MASIELGIILAAIGIILIVIAKLLHIDNFVNKLLYITGAIVLVIGIIIIIIAAVGIAI